MCFIPPCNMLGVRLNNPKEGGRSLSEFVQILIILCIFFSFLFVVFCFFCYRPNKFGFGFKRKASNDGNKEIAVTLDAENQKK